MDVETARILVKGAVTITLIVCIAGAWIKFWDADK